MYGSAGSQNRFLGKLPAEKFGRRLTRAVALAEQHDAILIRDRPVAADELQLSAPTLSATLLKSFTNAETDENYWVYRLSTKQAP